MKKKIIPLSLIIIFSVVLWGSVSLSGEYIATINVPLKLIDLPNNYTTGYISSKEVYLRVKSKGWELAKIFMGGEYEFHVSVHRKIGSRKIDLRNEIENNTWLTSTMQVIEIVPAQVECEVDKIISKTVEVSANYVINYQQGFGSASEIFLSPSQVKIYGPASVLKNIDTVKTEYVEFSNVTEPIKEELKFKEIEGITFSENTCYLQIDVQKIVDRSFDDILVEIRNVPSSKELILYPSKISIILNGGINILGRFTNDSVKAYVDYWEVVRSEGEPGVPVVEYPPYSTLIDVKPKQLEYIIKQY